MHVVIGAKVVIPPLKYGGIERVIYSLGRQLEKLGIKVTFLVQSGSSSTFCEVLNIDEEKPLLDQIPKDADLLHLSYLPKVNPENEFPTLVSIHGNTTLNTILPLNTNFISRDHANRHGSEIFVYNGLCWDNYEIPDLKAKMKYFHFLGKAAWRVKNLKGAISIVNHTPNEKLMVIGGNRLNFNMGFRFTTSLQARFCGMVDDQQKFALMNHSKGLIFPVLWHEPFGLAIIESLYSGCPVFGTPYGSLPELVPPNVGFLSNRRAELTEAVLNWEEYNRAECHEYASQKFNSQVMAEKYIHLYKRIIAGEKLHKQPPGITAEQQSKFLPWHL